MINNCKYGWEGFYEASLVLLGRGDLKEKVIKARKKIIHLMKSPEADLPPSSLKIFYEIIDKSNWNGSELDEEKVLDIAQKIIRIFGYVDHCRRGEIEMK